MKIFIPHALLPTPYSLLPAFLLLATSSFAHPVLAENENAHNQIKSFCSQQSLELLTTQLLRDLPNYANRATQRARRLSRSTDLFSYVLVAGKPEFTPLPLNSEENTAEAPKDANSGVEQVFFTTLERQYTAKTAVELQEFHWLLLTKTKSSWRLVRMFTQTGSYPAQKQQLPPRDSSNGDVLILTYEEGKTSPQTPPRDSSDGAIAQGVKAWLRDCEAGSVRMRAAN